MGRAPLLLTLLGVLTANGAAAAVVNLGGNINGAQAESCQTPPLSTAVGTVSATLDDVTGLFQYTVKFGKNAPLFDDGLLDKGTETAAHFHVGAPGVTGGITLALPLGGSISGSSILAPASISNVKAGLWYVNVHSTNCAGGEIRGQLLVVTAGSSLPGAGPYLLVAALALSVALALRTERARQ